MEQQTLFATQPQLTAAASADAGLGAATAPPSPTGRSPGNSPAARAHLSPAPSTASGQGRCLDAAPSALPSVPPFPTLAPSCQLPAGRAGPSAVRGGRPSSGPSRRAARSGAAGPRSGWGPRSYLLLDVGIAERHGGGVGGGGTGRKVRQPGPSATASGIKSGSGHSRRCCRCVTAPPRCSPGQ